MFYEVRPKLSDFKRFLHSCPFQAVRQSILRSRPSTDLYTVVPSTKSFQSSLAVGSMKSVLQSLFYKVSLPQISAQLSVPSCPAVNSTKSILQSRPSTDLYTVVPSTKPVRSCPTSKDLYKVSLPQISTQSAFHRSLHSCPFYEACLKLSDFQRSLQSPPSTDLYTVVHFTKSIRSCPPSTDLYTVVHSTKFI